MTGMGEDRAADGAHPMIAVPNHDELVEQLFVRDLKMLVSGTLEPKQRAIANALADDFAHSTSNDPVGDLRSRMAAMDSFNTWLSVKRESQRLLWATVGASVERQADALEGLAKAADPIGPVTLDPEFRAPDYIVDADIHLMPGGNAHDDGGILQGAVMDRGGAVFMLGRNGGMLNDLRGHTELAHLRSLRHDFVPERILDLGCGIGTSTVPATAWFPDAEVHGVDVGASMLRYAHARAQHLGAAIQFSQQNAERTDFADASFDLVYTCVVLHETSQSAVSNILAESRRLLRPGGVAIHLEVPLLHTCGDPWDELSAEMEAEFNNEPYWRGALTADYEALMQAAGFGDVRTGYQAAAFAGPASPLHFGPTSQGVFRSWFITSGTA